MDKNLTSEMAKPHSFWRNIKIPRRSVFGLKVMIFEKRNYEDCEKCEIRSIRKVNISSQIKYRPQPAYQITYGYSLFSTRIFVYYTSLTLYAVMSLSFSLTFSLSSSSPLSPNNNLLSKNV